MDNTPVHSITTWREKSLKMEICGKTSSRNGKWSTIIMFYPNQYTPAVKVFMKVLVSVC